MFDIPSGNNLRSRLSGMLVKNIRILLGNVEICWRIPNFLKADCIALLGESVLTCWLTLWGIKISGYVLLLNPSWYPGGQYN